MLGKTEHSFSLKTSVLYRPLSSWDTKVVLSNLPLQLSST